VDHASSRAAASLRKRLGARRSQCQSFKIICLPTGFAQICSMAADANIGATLNDVDGGIQVTATREDGSTHDSVMQLLHNAKIGSLVVR
jgi:hypothetical protein